MSVGIASIRGDRPVSADQLVAAADKSLYRAKEGGRDRIAISNEPIAPDSRPIRHA
jgi:PleD family two-component response regulator